MFLRYFDLINAIFIIKINSFRGYLTNVLAKTKTLICITTAASWVPIFFSLFRIWYSSLTGSKIEL